MGVFGVRAWALGGLGRAGRLVTLLREHQSPALCKLVRHSSDIPESPDKDPELVGPQVNQLPGVGLGQLTDMQLTPVRRLRKHAEYRTSLHRRAI